MSEIWSSTRVTADCLTHDAAAAAYSHTHTHTHAQCTSAAATLKASVYFMPLTSCGHHANETIFTLTNQFVGQQVPPPPPPLHSHTQENVAYSWKYQENTWDYFLCRWRFVWGQTQVYRAIDVTLSTVLCAALKLADKNTCMHKVTPDTSIYEDFL